MYVRQIAVFSKYACSYARGPGDNALFFHADVPEMSVRARTEAGLVPVSREQGCE